MSYLKSQTCLAVPNVVIYGLLLKTSVSELLHKNNSRPHDTEAFCRIDFSIQDEALSPQSQLSPISVSSDSSGFSEISLPPKKIAKRSSQGKRGMPLCESCVHKVIQRGLQGKK